MKNIAALQALLSSPKSIAIVMHQRPDADALGSGLALAALLKQQQHQVRVIAPSVYPAYLSWMVGAAEITIYAHGRHEQVAAVLNHAEIIFCVDFPTLDRIDEMAPMVAQTTATKVVIDHHPTADSFGDLVFHNTQAAATAELLYEMIIALGLQSSIDAAMADCLYAGLMTDTGSFKHPNTTAQTHRVAAQLMAHGADVAQVNRQVYGSKALNSLKFLGFALCHRLVVYEAYHTAYFVIKAEDYEQYQLQTGDTEGLVDYALSVQGIVFAAIIKETKEGIRISLRSVGDVPVNIWAQEHFGGGGHKNAAGGISYLSLEETIVQFEDLVKAKQEILNPHL